MSVIGSYLSELFCCGCTMVSSVWTLNNTHAYWLWSVSVTYYNFAWNFNWSFSCWTLLCNKLKRAPFEFLLSPQYCGLGAGSVLLSGHYEQSALRDEGVIYVAGHPLLNRRCTRLPGCIRLRNDLYFVGWGGQLFNNNNNHHLHYHHHCCRRHHHNHNIWNDRTFVWSRNVRIASSRALWSTQLAFNTW